MLTRTIFARNHVIPPENPPITRNNQPPRRTEYIFRGTMIENGTTITCVVNFCCNLTGLRGWNTAVKDGDSEIRLIALHEIEAICAGCRCSVLVGRRLPMSMTVYEKRPSDSRRYQPGLVAHDPSIADKVKRYQQRPAEELYDLANDPWEQHNVAALPENAETVAKYAPVIFTMCS